jgi:hypothetical protein
VHFLFCEEHYACGLCGKNPPSSPFFAERRVWCNDGCWEKHIENLKERLKKIQQVKNVIEQKYEKYFKIVDTFELGNYPDNVKRLESISNQLDNLSMSLGDISDALDSLLDSAKYLSKHKQ